MRQHAFLKGLAEGVITDKEEPEVRHAHAH